MAFARDDWWESHEERIALARWLEENCQLSTPDDVIRFFEQPWKWTPEWAQMRSEERAAA